VVPVVVSTDGVIFSDTVLNFTYYQSPAISIITPTSGPFSSNTTVQVRGEGFLDITSVVCSFGPSVEVPAIFISSSEVICIISMENVNSKKRAATSTVFLEVSLNGQQFTNTSDHPFIFFEPPTFLGISPPNGPAAGGTNLTIALNYIPDCDDFVVMWESNTVPSDCSTETSNVSIIVPPQVSGSEFFVGVNFSVNGQFWSSTNASFQYYGMRISICRVVRAYF